MADKQVPYMAAYGNITKALEKVKAAQVPSRFSQDFLETKLGLSGGSARPVIPFLKRTGFLGPDGAPTELYRRFRNDAQSGAAAAEALRIGYAPLFEINEYIHDAGDTQLKGVVVQATGAEPTSSTVGAIIGSFNALKAFADFQASPEAEAPPVDEPSEVGPSGSAAGGSGINLGYTINLNLPATSDIAVFDAIFKSLREHLL
ncbi:MAG TPA: DUF5343 domain-containing protein [Gaiellaceae bacterium]|jgi:hypothetical protein